MPQATGDRRSLGPSERTKRRSDSLSGRIRVTLRESSGLRLTSSLLFWQPTPKPYLVVSSGCQIADLSREDCAFPSFGK
jgi:hypothetical protein